MVKASDARHFNLKLTPNGRMCLLLCALRRIPKNVMCYDFDYNYYQDLYIWNDDMISGKEYTLKINVELEYNDEEDNFSSTYNYKVCLYRLSPELYKFLKSLNDISNNELGQNGLAPIRSHYSNITDGFGFLGAASLYETPWLDNPDSDETEVWTPAG